MFFIVIGFTASFRLLFGDVQGQCNLGLDGAGQIVNNCNPDPYNSLLQSLLSTFELSIIGSYDPSILYQTQSTFLAPLLFVLAITVILVIALNGESRRNSMY